MPMLAGLLTATVMRVAGKQHANSAAAALNANRQIGALVGVALAYGLAACLVYQHVRLPQVQAA